MSAERTPVQRLMDAVAWEAVPDAHPDHDGLLYATHQGVLTIGPCTLRVYTLNDGRRLIDASDLESFFGFKS